MVFVAGGGTGGRAASLFDFRLLVEECQASLGGSRMGPEHHSGLELAPAWQPSAIFSLFSAAEDAVRTSACVANGLMKSVGVFAVMLLLAVFVYKSTSTRFPAGQGCPPGEFALPTAMPISSLIVFNGLICGSVGKFVVGSVMGGNADVWFAAWVALMAVHACTVWMGGEICAAIDGDDIDMDDGDDGDDVDANVDKMRHKRVRGHHRSSSGLAPLQQMPFLFHALLGVVLPALVGVLPWCCPDVWSSFSRGLLL